MPKRATTPSAHDVLDTCLRILSKQAKLLETTGSAEMSGEQMSNLEKVTRSVTTILNTTSRADKIAKTKLSEMTSEELEAKALELGD